MMATRADSLDYEHNRLPLECPHECRHFVSVDYHVDRAHARMDEVGGDFVPKSLVLQKFSDVGDRSFKTEFASIGDRIIDIEAFGALLEEIELFAKEPSLFTQRPRLDALD